MADGADDLGQMFAAVDLHHQVEQGGGRGFVGHGQLDDIGIGFGDFCCQTAQDAAFVLQGQFQACRQVPCRVRPPDDRNPAFRFTGALACGHRAVEHVHHQAMAQPDAADDGVAWQRTTARGQLDRLAFVAMNDDGRAGRRREFVHRHGGGFQHVVFGRKSARHHGRQTFAQTDVGQDFFA